MLKLNIGFALLQTKASFADSAKLMLNLPSKVANGSNVWPLLQESLADFAPFRGEISWKGTDKSHKSLAAML